MKNLEQIEKEYSIRYAHFDVTTLVGFINPKGLIIGVPNDLHEQFLKKLKRIGISRMDYQCKYGAIRLRYNTTQSVEIFKKPTLPQMKQLSKIRCKIHYDFWSNVWSRCEPNGVHWYTFIKKVREYNQELKRLKEVWTINY